MRQYQRQIHEYVVSQLKHPGAHGLDHTLRVTSMSQLIGSLEHADMRILLPSAMLHDIARDIEEKTGKPHEIEGARMAETFLKSIEYPSELIPPIIHAILVHRFRTSSEPETLEACIVSDADKLDAIGAVGLARAFISSGERGGDMNDAITHVNHKLIKLASMMYTPAAQKIALERHDVLCSFLNSLQKEMHIEVLNDSF